MLKNRKVNSIPVISALALTSLLGFIVYSGGFSLSDYLASPDSVGAQQTFNISNLPTNLRATGLDSTIRLEWEPVVDDRIAWHVITTRDQNGKIVSTKIVHPGGNAVDINGLRTGDQYHISLQLLSKAQELSRSLQLVASTKLQLPMQNAVFYDNFNALEHGPMDPNYYDVRTFSEFGDTMGIPDAINTMVSERHYHTQLIESNGDGGLHARARVPVSLRSSL